MADDAKEHPGPLEDRGDGVDVTLIRWMLSLSPSDRLDALQGFVDSVIELRRGARRT